ncbi:hypothetical protein SAMN05216466_104188 [Paraburkholderia phenazinium]|uniref:Uncharacterized protein n=1 Tax=Paraburkholderia phenazinium TaxID=60549 RepID=A0A1G7VQY4_9BURK|nr:hypothetical protein SAMN05216466_104188 [Paraburkholderia phenazinium]
MQMSDKYARQIFVCAGKDGGYYIKSNEEY